MEVLRGPQGTLFGRNTIGGIINVTRTRPGGAPGGKIRAGYEEYDTYYSAYGYCSPALDSTITGDRRETANIGYIPPDPNGAVINTSTPDQAREAEMLATFDADTHIVETRWQASDDLRLDYVFGYYETDETIISNWDGTPEFLYGTTRPATYEQSTHEFRVNWDNGGAINAVAGAYLAVRLSLFARNLLDEEGYTHGYDVAGLWSYAATRPPRTIGAELVYNLGG